ncbi:hypothetical protein G7K71_08190 [Desulfofundulus sp. TPOSR]|uniref:hypothetical protein n=1 Tax=Desulfofundulus sp. TPOSR TaxID=2714340 RepID=UPI00140A4295|nr:hypothetical protein [Desulfofundulus sp. TPOSR]NHM26962.1 hypothetical protein [Desulfofundulus sp. TPOSR]
MFPVNKMTFKVLAIYFKKKIAKLKKGRPRLYFDILHGECIILPDVVIWTGYGLYLAAMLFAAWQDGWEPAPVVRALTVGGWLLFFHLAVVAFYLAYLVWKDLVRERRNEWVDLSWGEIRRGEFDFERWCR